jgi:hypothetical protein
MSLSHPAPEGTLATHAAGVSLWPDAKWLEKGV